MHSGLFRRSFLLHSLRFHCFRLADEVLQFHKFAGGPAGAPAACLLTQPAAFLLDAVKVVHRMDVIPGKDIPILTDECIDLFEEGHPVWWRRSCCIDAPVPSRGSVLHGMFFLMQRVIHSGTKGEERYPRRGINRDPRRLSRPGTPFPTPGGKVSREQPLRRHRDGGDRVRRREQERYYARPWGLPCPFSPHRDLMRERQLFRVRSNRNSDCKNEWSGGDRAKTYFLLIFIFRGDNPCLSLLHCQGDSPFSRAALHSLFKEFVVEPPTGIECFMQTCFYSCIQMCPILVGNYHIAFTI